MKISNAGKTNWKYILIVLVFGFLAAAGVWYYFQFFQQEIKQLIEGISKVPQEEFVSGGQECLRVPKKLWETAFQRILGESGADSGCGEDEEPILDNFNAACEEIDLNDDAIAEFIISKPEMCGMPVFLGVNEWFPLFFVYKKAEDRWVEILEYSDAQSYSISGNRTNEYRDIITASAHRDYISGDPDALVATKITWQWSQEEKIYKVGKEETVRE